MFNLFTVLKNQLTDKGNMRDLFCPLSFKLFEKFKSLVHRIKTSNEFGPTNFFLPH